MKTPLTTENPFSAMADIIVNDSDFSIHTFRKEFSLSHEEAKIIWVSCPEFQERFCRKRIAQNKSRGGSKYGSKHFLRRRYKFSEQELEVIFNDIWNNQADIISTKFLAILNTQRIAESQLTLDAQVKLKQLQTQYDN